MHATNTHNKTYHPLHTWVWRVSKGSCKDGFGPSIYIMSRCTWTSVLAKEQHSTLLNLSGLEEDTGDYRKLGITNQGVSFPLYLTFQSQGDALYVRNVLFNG
jgi:hypothetical protein